MASASWSPSLWRLGQCYLYGDGVVQDCQQAASCYRTLADRDDVWGLASLGQCYWSGCGVQACAQQAKNYLRRAMELDPENAYSLFVLADVLSCSLDAEELMQAQELVHRIPPKAELWYERSQWSLSFIEDQMYEIEFWSRIELQPDFISIAELELVALIGQGQFGKVYLGRLRRTKWVAVKFIKASLVTTDAQAARNILRERFTCRILKANQIRGVASYLGFVDDIWRKTRGLIFDVHADLHFVQSRLDKLPLDKGFTSARDVSIDDLPDWSLIVQSSLRSAVVFAPQRRWPLKKIIGMLADTAEALARLHTLGFLHRDIAARNVLCDANGKVLLADFGLAKFSKSNVEDGDTMVEYRKKLTAGHHYGIAWCAPECVNLTRATFSINSDIYSFGILMWQCFAHADPFDEITEDLVDAASVIGDKILAGGRPDLTKVDSDTPTELIQLMQMCWQADPEQRPDLDLVAKILREVQRQEPAKKRGRPTKLSTRGLSKRWFDVDRMYLQLPLRSLESLSQEASPGSFLRARYKQRLSLIGHALSPSLNLSRAAKSTFASSDLPYDLFLIHTGAQKRNEVATLHDIFSSRGFRCFFDMEMNPGKGSPRTLMESALESCRHAVVVLSRAFLSSKPARAELRYAHKRMQWLRAQGSERRWESLWIVLYDISVDEYSEISRCEENLRLPPLNADIVLMEFASGTGKYESWPHLCHLLKASIVEHDSNQLAIQRWQTFLENWQERHESDFPLVTGLYSAAGGGTSPESCPGHVEG